MSWVISYSRHDYCSKKHITDTSGADICLDNGYAMKLLNILTS